MSRNELVADQRKTLTRIAVLEKMLAKRQPKVEKAAQELVEARKEALRKVEEDYKRKTAKLTEEYNKIQGEVSLLKKRYIELATDAVRVAV